MILSSPHVHTQFCDGKSTAEEMVRAAIAGGCQSLGFSGHAPQLFDPPCCMSAQNEIAYRAEVRRLQQAYAPQLRIWLGMELDLFASADTAEYDYLIGSVHYLPCAGGFVAVDGAPEPIRRLCQQEYRGDGLAMAREYYRLYAALMRSRKPAIGGHIDLIRKSNALLGLFDETAPAYRRAVQEALDAALESGVTLEVNTGGMARYNAPAPYPSRWILERWRDMGGQVILASDCHFAPQLLAAYDQAVTLLLDIGYRTARVLGTGDELFVETELERLA